LTLLALPGQLEPSLHRSLAVRHTRIRLPEGPRSEQALAHRTGTSLRATRRSRHHGLDDHRPVDPRRPRRADGSPRRLRRRCTGTRRRSCHRQTSGVRGL